MGVFGTVNVIDLLLFFFGINKVGFVLSENVVWSLIWLILHSMNMLFLFQLMSCVFGFSFLVRWVMWDPWDVLWALLGFWSHICVYFFMVLFLLHRQLGCLSEVGFSFKVPNSLSLSLSLRNNGLFGSCVLLIRWSVKVCNLVLVNRFSACVCAHWGCTYSGTCLLGFWCYVRRICYNWASLKLQDFCFNKLLCWVLGCVYLFFLLALDVWVIWL